MSGPTLFREKPIQAQDDDALARGERALLVVLCGLAGFRYILGADLTVAVLLSLALCVVWIPLLRRFRLATAFMVALAAAAVYGVVITAINGTSHVVLSNSAQSRVTMIVSLGATVGLLLWGRARIGDRTVPIAFGAGMVAAIALHAPHGGNPWRFTFSIPLTILILALAAVTGRWWLEVLALLGLAGIGLANDSRSNSAMLLLAAAVVAWQRLRVFGSTRQRRAGGVVWVVLAGAAVFFLIQSAILDGYFGEATQARTQAQIERGGSVFTGGRPEMAASWALITAYPLGLGAGIRASTADIMHAKQAMIDIGYDPNNGYVQRYLFGAGIEVHSMLGDFWIWFGLAGAALAALMLTIIVIGVDHGLRTSAITGLFLYLAIRFVWDLLFSPAGSSMQLTSLALALAMVPIGAVAARSRSAPALSAPDAAPRPGA